MAEVHVLLATASIRLELIMSTVRRDTCMVTQPPCKVLWVDVIWHGPVLPYPLGKDIVMEHVSDREHPSTIAGKLFQFSYNKENVPQGINRCVLVGLWSHCTAPSQTSRSPRSRQLNSSSWMGLGTPAGLCAQKLTQWASSGGIVAAMMNTLGLVSHKHWHRSCLITM